MLIYVMKILYMPGLASITDKSYDLSKSYKLVHLLELADCTVFDYKKFKTETIRQYTANFDILFGSSFGGYFAFYLSVITGKPSISVNPSLYLDTRINSLLKQYPKELSFIDPKALKSLKRTPTGEPHPHVSVLMNMNDEVLDANKVVAEAENFGCSVYTYEKGGHQSTNFQGDMLPTVKMILNSL